MKKEIINRIIFVLALILIILGLIYLSNQIKDKPFNNIELEDRSIIVNNFTEFSYYDTIIVAGLMELGIQNVVVNVGTLSDAAKENFRNQGGESLSAHIKELDGSFYLFISPDNRFKQIEVISHELIHLQQYHSNDLIVKNDTIFWKKVPYMLYETQYDQRPWEEDAFSRGRGLQNKLNNILYSE